MGVVRRLADPVQEVDGEVVFVLCEPDLASEGVQMADERCHELA